MDIQGSIGTERQLVANYGLVGKEEPATQLPFQLEVTALNELEMAQSETALMQQRLAALMDAHKRTLAETELLNAIATTASGEDDLNQLLLAALNQLRRVVRFTGGTIALVEGDELIIEAAVGPFAATALGQRQPRGQGRSWQVVETGQPLLSNDVIKEGFKPSNPFRSFLAVPLVWRGQAFGLLALDSTTTNAFTEADQLLLQRLALTLSGSIELARRYADLQEALKRQQEVDYLKDLFVSIASHELRSPLSAIQGFAEILQNKWLQLQEDQRQQLAQPAVPLPTRDLTSGLKAIKTIIRQTGRMNALIGQMLDFSRLQTEDIQLNYKNRVDLAELVQQVVEQQRVAYPARTIAIEAAPAGPLATCDDIRVERVLINLLNNALKYSPPTAPVTVGLKFEPEASEQSKPKEAVFWVRDEGQGISLDQQPYIFDRFYRVRTEQSHRVEGLGLGLYISQQIVSRHGGRMWLSSQSGVGSTFYFALPLEQSIAV